MEFIPVATTVYGLAQTIQSWIEGQSAKDATIQQISATAYQIQSIISPLTTSDFSPGATNHDHRLSLCLSGLAHVLKQTQKHLREWDAKSLRRVWAFVSPLSVVKELEDDDRQLNHHLLILVAAISIIGYTDQRGAGATGTAERAGAEIGDLPELGCDIRSEATNVEQFWAGFVGIKTPLVDTGELIQRLEMYLGFSVSKAFKKICTGRLDEFGVVTLQNLKHEVGSEDVRDWCHGVLTQDSDNYDYHHNERPAVQHIRDLSAPLVLWVDDHPENNKDLVIHARSVGVNVVELPSTSSAVSFINRNIGRPGPAPLNAVLKTISI
ncbi:hypothetical protein DXG01_006616 [Tephrocybe rancida]|nr:hypothetical protein DXG01_006616 [Tephrocybe rancida]